LEKHVINCTGALLLVCILLAVPHPDLYAQSQKVNNNYAVQLEGSLSLDSLTRYIHRQTGIRFSFNSGKVKGNRLIYFPKGRYTAAQLLNHIRKNTSLYYTSYKGYIIFTDNPLPATSNIPSTGKTVALTPPKNKKQTSPAATVRSPGPPKKLPASMISSSDTMDLLRRKYTMTPVAALSMLPPQLADTNKAIRWLVKNITQQAPVPLPLTVTSPGSKRDRQPLWHFQTGFTATEVFYSSLSAEAGIRPLHLTGGIVTNYSITGWKIGAGSVIRSTDKTQWQLAAGIHFLQKSQSFDSASQLKDITLKGRLYRAEALWCKKLGTRWLLKTGLAFNTLRTRYYYEGAASLYQDLPLPFRNSGKVSLLDPPFVLSKKEEPDRSPHIKNWIGITAGIYFVLFNKNN